MARYTAITAECGEALHSAARQRNGQTGVKGSLRRASPALDARIGSRRREDREDEQLLKISD
jgi:hypothetical protein